MQFNNISKTTNPYLDNIANIIREGIKIETPKLNINDNENKKNQALTDCFNIIGTQNPQMWIGVQKEHIGANAYREDIYFYLNDDLRTRVFYIEAKRLPKQNSTDDEEYVDGKSVTGNPSGGIQRFILGIHGNPENMNNYGMIGYVENKTIADWLLKVNLNIEKNYSASNLLIPISAAEFFSKHNFDCHVQGQFSITHFWIDLTNKS
jgi:hypothetical protein